MRSIVAVFLILLTMPAAALAHHPPKPHPLIEQHKHDHKMKKAAANCCREQNPHHFGLHHKHHH